MSEVRERLAVFGVEGLGDAECLGLVLGGDTSTRAATDMAHKLLQDFGGLAALERAELGELTETPGVGPVRAGRLVAALSLARRIQREPFRPGRAIRSPGDLARLLREETRSLQRESFWSVSLDVRHRLLAVRRVSIGHLTGSPVHPRELFMPLIRDSAAAVVVAHNHPSGDPSPSPEDRSVTDRLQEAGRLLGIELLDHLVLGATHYHSFADGITRAFSEDSSRAAPTSAAVSTRRVNGPR